MQAKRVWAMYWSATGTTERAVTAVAAQMAETLGLPLGKYDFTLPAARQGAPDFQPEDVVVFGTPTYAGRVPNVLLKYLATVKGNGAAAVPVVTFGNRAFDDSLIELRDILCGGAFVFHHACGGPSGRGRSGAGGAVCKAGGGARGGAGRRYPGDSRTRPRERGPGLLPAARPGG